MAAAIRLLTNDLHTTTTTTTSGTSSITNCCESLLAECEQIVNISNPYQRAILLQVFSELPEEASHYCIMETALAPRPSIKYLLTIAGRIRREGWHPGQQRKGKAAAAQSYEQREYSPGMELPDWMKKRLSEL